MGLGENNMAWYSEQLGTFDRAKSFIYGNLKYGASAFTNPEILATATIYPMRVEPVDTKYYIQGEESRDFEGGVWIVSYEAIPKEVETLKKELTAETIKWFDTTLSQSDRFITRGPEIEEYMVNKALNPALKVWRADVFIALEERLLQIANADTFEQLKSIGAMPEMSVQPDIMVDD
jgi:hypothetical protein